MTFVSKHEAERSIIHLTVQQVCRNYIAIEIIRLALRNGIVSTHQPPMRRLADSSVERFSLRRSCQLMVTFASSGDLTQRK